jgi:peptidoglycan/LPS O-acetylase OafA/YrhL
MFLVMKTNRARVRFLAVTIAGLWIYREILIFLVHRGQGYIYEAFDTRADHLLIGCLLAVVLFEGMYTALWRTVCSGQGLVWVPPGLLIVSTAIAMRSTAVYRDAVGFVIDPVLIAVLIVQTIAHERSGFAIFLNLKWVRYLGTISYSIYLYQQVIIVPVKHATAGVPLISLPATLAVVILAASASYWFIEKPFLRIKDRFARPESNPRRSVF